MIVSTLFALWKYVLPDNEFVFGPFVITVPTINTLTHMAFVFPSETNDQLCRPLYCRYM